jgi:hypothetical protein
MKLEDLKERLKAIENNLSQTRANYNALEGSKQELLYWVGKLEEEAKAEI